LHGFAYPAFLSGYLLSGLPCLAPYCVRGGVRCPWITLRWFSFESRSHASVCGATRGSDRPRYPNGSTVGTAPRHGRFIQDAGCGRRRTPLLLGTWVNKGKEETATKRPSPPRTSFASPSQGRWSHGAWPSPQMSMTEANPVLQFIGSRSTMESAVHSRVSGQLDACSA
jgi:hypothetical protein